MARKGHTHLMTSADLIGTSEAATILNVSNRTVKRMAKDERLPYVLKMTGDTGAYLFKRSDVEKLAKAMAS